jgi:A/G-specific adenine glycosylase
MDQGMPQSYDGWLALPGIGPYTAGAITAIGYNKPAVAIDGNIRRVFSRYFGIKGVDWLNEVAKQARAQLPKNRFGDYTQALMDFGATICKTHQPQCAQCPLASSCYARCVGPIADFPPKIPKGTVKNQSGHFFIAHDADRGLWMRQAGPMDLLPGLWGFPSTPWTSTHADSPADIWSHACTYAGQISHRFTHIALQAHYWLAKDPCALVALFSDQGFTGQWVGWAHLPQYPISTLVRKIIHSVFGSQSKIRTER